MADEHHAHTFGANLVKLIPCGPKPFDGSPKLIRTQRGHPAGIQFLPAPRGFFNSIRAGVLVAVWRKRVEEPCCQSVAFDLRKFRNRILNLSERHRQRVRGAGSKRKLSSILSADRKRRLNMTNVRAMTSQPRRPEQIPNFNLFRLGPFSRKWAFPRPSLTSPAVPCGCSCGSTTRSSKSPGASASPL